MVLALEAKTTAETSPVRRLGTVSRVVGGLVVIGRVRVVPRWIRFEDTASTGVQGGVGFKGSWFSGRVRGQGISWIQQEERERGAEEEAIRKRGLLRNRGTELVVDVGD